MKKIVFIVLLFHCIYAQYTIPSITFENRTRCQTASFQIVWDLVTTTPLSDQPIEGRGKRFIIKLIKPDPCPDEQGTPQNPQGAENSIALKESKGIAYKEGAHYIIAVAQDPKTRKKRLEVRHA